MIITVAGNPGSGKSSLVREIAEKLGIKRHSVGNFRREMARKRGMTLAQLNALGEKEEFTDKEADDWQINIGKTEDNFIIEGRLSYHFIPNSIKIFLDVSPQVGSRRIMHEKREEELMGHQEEAIKMWHERVDSDIKRYKKYYNINPYDKKHFDLVIDTTSLSKEETLKKVLEFIKKAKDKV
jgi:CMP/dCMP kinase